MSMFREYDAEGVLIAEWDDGQPDPVTDPGTVQATVDVAAYDVAVTRAKTATTIAGLRGAVLDLAAAITPAGT